MKSKHRNRNTWWSSHGKSCYNRSQPAPEVERQFACTHHCSDPWGIDATSLIEHESPVQRVHQHQGRQQHPGAMVAMHWLPQRQP
jgi:hypothetical protein